MKTNNISWCLGVLMLSLLFSPAESKAQMETKAGDLVLSAGASYSDISLGYNGSFQFNVTDKIAAHPSFNYNTYGGGSLLSVDAWGGYHGLKNIPYLGASAEGKDNIDAYVMMGPTFFKDDDDGGYAFGAGGGARYYFNSKMGITVEGKYRMIVGGDGYSHIRWYDLGVSFSYAL